MITQWSLIMYRDLLIVLPVREPSIFRRGLISLQFYLTLQMMDRDTKLIAILRRQYHILLNSQPRTMHFAYSDWFTQSWLSPHIPLFDLIW